MLSEALKAYIDTRNLPLCDGFDAAYRRDHVDMVAEQSMAIASHCEVDMDMVYAVAAYHDTGLAEDRKTHNSASGRIVREDMWPKGGKTGSILRFEALSQSIAAGGLSTAGSLTAAEALPLGGATVRPD